MTYQETYQCRVCGWQWTHLWDTEDYNNDFTACPECFETDFYEINQTPLTKSCAYRTNR